MMRNNIARHHMIIFQILAMHLKSNSSINKFYVLTLYYVHPLFFTFKHFLTQDKLMIFSCGMTSSNIYYTITLL